MDQLFLIMLIPLLYYRKNLNVQDQDNKPWKGSERALRLQYVGWQSPTQSWGNDTN